MKRPWGPVTGRALPRPHFRGPLGPLADCYCSGYMAARAGLDRRNLRRALVLGDRPISDAQRRALGPVVREMVRLLESVDFPRMSGAGKANT